MKLFTLLTACLAHLPALAQFGIIADEDGFVNIRSSAEITNNIIEKANNGEIVYCFEAEGDWLSVDYHLGEWNKSGYIHKSRVMLIDQFEEVPFVQFTDTSITYRMDTVTIKITTKSFEPDDNNLQYFQDTSGNSEAIYLEKINGKKIWGTDGNIPRRQYEQIVVQFVYDKILLPTENLFEPDLDYTMIHINKKKRTLYIAALNSDGAGGYAVLWIVQDGKLKEWITTIPF